MSKLDLKARLEQVQAILPAALRHPAVLASLQAALAEDLEPQADCARLWPHPAEGDISASATLPADSQLAGRIFAKASGVVAGLPVAQAVFTLVDPDVQFVPRAEDGQAVSPGQVLAEMSGPGRAILAAERSALNYLGRMSGTASLARQFVQAVAGTRAVILDTRKTAPGLRYFDKYAVLMGGAANHRTGLFDMVMIKDNHIDGAGGITPAVARVRHRFGKRYAIEVEVKNLAELQEALALDVTRIMLDNMSLEDMRAAVVLAAGRTPLEASGNVSLATVRAIAETGVDFISSGALTHSAPAFDISLRLVRVGLDRP
jgi:nicotinate-nucleotide pyrophosphorylase (carboxylating)